MCIKLLGPSLLVLFFILKIIVLNSDFFEKCVSKIFFVLFMLRIFYCINILLDMRIYIYIKKEF